MRLFSLRLWGCLVLQVAISKSCKKIQVDGDHLIEGPIFIKIDSGPERNSKSECAIKFWYNMQNECLHMVLAYQTPLALLMR